LPTKFNYITTEDYTALTDRTVSNLAEWERQADIASRLIDLTVGPHPSFHIRQDITITSADFTTFVSGDLNEDKDDFYNNLRVEIKQGTGSVYKGFITDYVSSSTTCTVSGAFSAVPDSTSFIYISQPAVFPRRQDRDTDGRPFIPDAVTEATAYAIEFWDIKGGDDGINATEFISAGGKLNEKIGSYSITYEDSSDVRKLIGNKSYLTLQKAGLIRRHGSITGGTL